MSPWPAQPRRRVGVFCLHGRFAYGGTYIQEEEEEEEEEEGEEEEEEQQKSKHGLMEVIWPRILRFFLNNLESNLGRPGGSESIPRLISSFSAERGRSDT